MHWYVNVENQSYGPYSDDQMRGFVFEGRITTNSLISNNPQTGFYGAAEYDDFNLWSGEVQQGMLTPLVTVGAGAVQATAAQYAPIQPIQKQQMQKQDVQKQQQAQSYQIQQYEQPQAIQVTQQVQASLRQETQPAVQDANSCVFLIMAEIRSSGEMAFLHALQNFGQAERVGDTVWLVRSTHSVEQIRNTLSQSLNQQDRLFILDSKAGKTAWFNIGADLDHRIRELWDEGAG